MHAISLIFACLALLLTHSSAIAQIGSTSSTQADIGSLNSSTDEEFLPVEQAYVLNAEFEQFSDQSSSRLRLNWQIASGYYLYRHGFKFTLTDTTSNEPTTGLETHIPDGKAKNDEYFGPVEVYYHNADITIDNLPKHASLTLAVTSQGCADAGLCYPPYTEYFTVDSISGSISRTEKLAKDTTTNISATQQLYAPPSPQSQQSLSYILLLAVLGGAILNLMPCVFPVLSLKVLSFANDKNHNSMVHGATYSIGVILSFILVAAILISLQTAGEAVGWGFHLQSPWFVAALAYLFFVMGLSLSGFTEFGSQWMNTGSTLANKSGYGGSFFTGVLATVVASPCTAPFMGTALGFAVTQPAVIALSVFAALGFGMSLPVLLLSCSPALLHKIPKPGPWMVHLKELLAFPLYATAVWLCWVVGNQTGVNAMAAVLLGCVMITLAIWLWNEGVIKRSLSAASAALAISLLASPMLAPASNTEKAITQQSWQTYSPQVLSELRKQGKPVFINITADWCITCLANEKVTLSTERVQQAFFDNGITYLKGDWTNHDSTITELLNRYGRTGIPLYLVYPANRDKQATVLPQILTSDIVIEALTQAVN